MPIWVYFEWVENGRKVPVSLWAAVVAGLLVVAIATYAGAQSGETQTPQQVAGWWLAERDPGGRTRIIFDTVAPNPGSELRATGTITTAQFAALEATRVPNSHRAPTEVRIGDAYDLLWNGQAVRVQITGLFAQAGEYDVKIGAEVAPDAAGEAKLSVAGGGYFLARQTGTGAAPAAGNAFSAALFPVELPGAVQAQIGAMLTPRALEAAAEMLRNSGDPQNPYEGWLHRFLASTPSAPRLDIQGVRLAGTAAERYLVRAEWSANGVRRFVLGAWIALTPAPAILSVDMTAPEAVQSGFDCCSPSEAVMGMDDAYPRLLGAVGLGDGRTGVIRKHVAYEGSGVELDVYSDAAGLVPTDLFVPDM